MTIRSCAALLVASCRHSLPCHSPLHHRLLHLHELHRLRDTPASATSAATATATKSAAAAKSAAARARMPDRSQGASRRRRRFGLFLRLLERRSLRALVDQGAIVIAGGGGGIPVVLDPDGSYRRVEAVIDKDLAGEKLAESVGADIYLILTDVKSVSLDFGTERQRSIGEITVSQAREYLREGQFGQGSMAPKVLGCIQFIEFGGERAVITGINWAEDALAGRTGTQILPG
ncbi:MAG: hypothetical protein IID45_06990 [Planctomycetes bacterium]|nr:hypothetical protein [Planctomycetota bacterium]